METNATDQTIIQFIERVSEQYHAMAGAVIALSAAQAGALGLACMRISRDAIDSGQAAIDQRIARVDAIKNELLQWCERDADAIAEFVALREAGEMLRGQRLLCHAPATVSHLCVETANLLQAFRPFVNERVQDDLEMSISLLAGTAQAATLLLDSNLRIWPEAALLDEFEPILEALVTEIGRLSPVKRIRL